jgi:small conductance mechanosensitive channel
MAIIDYIINRLQYLFDVLSGLTNKIIIALIILLVGFIIGRVISRLVGKALKGVGLNKAIREISGIKVSFEEIISHFLLYFIYFITIIMALRYVGIATDVLNIISGVIILLIGIFILLSIKDFIPNVISGIVLHQKATIKNGDTIEVNHITGTVEEITLLDTKLKTKSGDIIIIPNSNLTKNEVIKKQMPKNSRKKSK